MSFNKCIKGKMKSGEIDKDRGKEAVTLFNEIEAEARIRMSPEDAARFAGEEAHRVLTAEKTHKKRTMGLAARAQGRIEGNLKQYRDGKGNENIAQAAEALFDRDEYARYSNIEARRKEVLGVAHSMMVDTLATFRKTMSGQAREPATLKNMIREVFQENTGDGAARQLADGWSKSAEYVRERFNQAGGRIPKRTDWGMPQMHDTMKVRKAPFTEWRDFIEPLLDRRKVIDEATGAPITTARLEIALKEVYETIITDGGNRMTPSGRANGTAIASRRLDHRFLAFRSADDWMGYQARFGSADSFSTMMGHLDGMSRDIGIMEILGPNPNATKNWLEQTVIKDAKIRDGAGGTGEHVNQANKSVKRINGMYRMITGSTSSPVNAVMANTLSGTRQFLVSAQLGSAMLSAISDVAFQGTAILMNGLNPVREAKGIFKLFRPGVNADQKLAVRMGLIADSWSSTSLAQARYTGDVAFGEIGTKLSDAVLRASLLSPWTQAGRHAFGLEFLATLADNSVKAFDELPNAVQKTFKRYGIVGSKWDQIRATPLWNESGVDFLDPAAIRAREDLLPGEAEGLATQVMEMIQTETEFAVPSTSLRGRVALLGESRPGTVQGELLRSFAMYKSFPVTIYYTHIRRMLAEEGLARKGIYAGGLLTATTLMGTMALQAKQIAQGKDPRPMDDRFWIAAAIQGGGLGLFGDFIYSSQNRFGGGITSSVAGPVVGLAQDFTGFIASNIAEVAQGKDPKLGRDAVNLLKRYTPGGSLWYARLGFERLVLDNIQEAVDPAAGKAFRAKQRKTKREYGQGYWWGPGKNVPSRAPNFGNIARK